MTDRESDLECSLDKMSLGDPNFAHAAQALLLVRVKRFIDAVGNLEKRLMGVGETIYRSSQGMQEKFDHAASEQQRAFTAQSRQQYLIGVLTLIITAATAVYTWITWESVVAMREANSIQSQLLELQRAHPQTPPQRDSN